jgi:hypothetical protein
MKPFVMEPKMTTMRGVFYPTGHVILMLPNKAEVDKAVHAMCHAGVPPDEISLLSPEVIMRDIARTVGNADAPFPSPGTEADTVRHLTELAAAGEWGVLVHAPHAKDSDLVMHALKGIPVTYAQKYRQLVIEDMEAER